MCAPQIFFVTAQRYSKTVTKHQAIYYNTDTGLEYKRENAYTQKDYSTKGVIFRSFPVALLKLFAKGILGPGELSKAS